MPLVVNMLESLGAGIENAMGTGLNLGLKGAGKLGAYVAYGGEGAVRSAGNRRGAALSTWDNRRVQSVRAAARVGRGAVGAAQAVGGAVGKAYGVAAWEPGGAKGLIQFVPGRGYRVNPVLAERAIVGGGIGYAGYRALQGPQIQDVQAGEIRRKGDLSATGSLNFALYKG